MDDFNFIPVTADLLLGIDLFRDLPAGDRSLIAQHCVGKEYAAHKLVLTQKDLSGDVYFVISGRVRVTYFSISGKEVTFREQNAGEMFGELSAIDAKPRSTQVITGSDAILASMSSTDFQALLQENSKLACKVMQHLTSLVRLLSERIVEFSALAVKNRIHAELLWIALKGKVVDGRVIIKPVPTHADISTRISSHREAVTRELKRLEQKGLLERHHDKWIILDLERLQTMVLDVLGV